MRSKIGQDEKSIIRKNSHLPRTSIPTLWHLIKNHYEPHRYFAEEVMKAHRRMESHHMGLLGTALSIWSFLTVLSSLIDHPSQLRLLPSAVAAHQHVSDPPAAESWKHEQEEQKFRKSFVVDTDYGVFDEPSELEYANVLDALRSHIGDLYAHDLRFDKHSDDTDVRRLSYQMLAHTPWVNQLKSDTLWVMNLQIQNKTDRTQYFQRLQQHRHHKLVKLSRYARAVVFHGAKSTPDVREYVVGPMDAPTEVRLVKVIPFYKRPLGGIEYGALIDFLSIICAQLDPVLQQAYNASFFRSRPSKLWDIPISDEISAILDRSATSTMCHEKNSVSHEKGRPNCLIPTFASPLVSAGAPGRRKVWFRMMFEVAPFIQYPVDLQLKVDHTSIDPSQWTLDKIWFQDHFYASVDELLSGFTSGRVKVASRPFINFYPGQLSPGPKQTMMNKKEPAGTAKKSEETTESVVVSSAAGRFAFRNPVFSHSSPVLKETDAKEQKEVNSHKQSKDVHGANHRSNSTSLLYKHNRISVTNRHVSYQHWDFHFTVHRDTGLRVFGVKFQGISLIAEGGLDEAVTLYWGLSPYMRMMTSIESMFGVGSLLGELSPGIDCPSEAIYFPVRLIPSGEVGLRTFRHGVCLFEWTPTPPAGPVHRHFEFPLNDSAAAGGTNLYEHTNFAFGVTSRALVLRMISSLFNYDYIFDVIFHPSGSIDFAMSPTGYIHLDTFWSPSSKDSSTPQQRPWEDENAYGFISNTYPIIFVIHHHLYNYKLDIDIVDSKNYLRYLHVHGPLSGGIDKDQNQRPGHFNDTTSPPLWMSLHTVHNEMEARFVQKFEEPRQFFICKAPQTEEEKKKRNPPCLLLKNKATLKTLMGHEHTKSFAWARYQVIVTRQHDKEPHSSSIYNGVDLEEPEVDFDKFSSNNETIYNEDVVLWTTFGSYHMPQQEDLPNLPTSDGRLELTLVPHNIFQFGPQTFSCDRFYTQSIDEWIKGSSEPDVCKLESIPVL
ncbi:unnamed protein product [Calicophoron daubneyi]|uniref:Amine oxidase n=1 Tax=Calicophoron daubneyi TaxID=300641 RepID=A0AAV2TX27_CALDB